MTQLPSRRVGPVGNPPRTIVEVVIEELRQRIIDGTLAPGTRLGHEHIGAELGVSHIPVREAILTLDREGWVEYENHRGARVLGLTAADIADDYELRGIVFGLIGGRAVEHATSTDIAEFKTLLTTMRNARGFQAFEDANTSFLEHVQTVGASPQLNAALLVTPPIKPETFAQASQSIRRLRQHGAARFVEALVAKNSSAADEALSESLARLGATAAQLIGARAPGRVASSPSRALRASRRTDPTSADAVAAHVRRLIFDGELQAGQRLPQDEIAAVMGVSRIPVRQGIITLEREGWIRTEPRRGSYVNPFNSQAIVDRFSLYGRFYAFATRRAITRISAEDLARLNSIVSELVAASTAAELDKASLDYLGTIIRIADSPRLRAVLRSTAQIVPGNFYEVVPAAIHSQQRGIARLQNAIERGSTDDAIEACLDLQRRHAHEVVAVREQRQRERAGT